MRGQPIDRTLRIQERKRKREAAGENTTGSVSDLPGAASSMSPVDYARLLFTEVRQSKILAAEGESWQAVALLNRQEREAYDVLQREIAALAKPSDGDSGLTPDQLVDQVILPALRVFPRPLLERVYLEAGVTLGVDPEGRS